ncbi:unnamed protein product (macronuclear) [Paramecium tetraurelia]|uniref:Uncharacterized protein n=1 Tax=Paramecium tetraurelia TaxID=5888 RepID=A0CZG5_PARTE|nr:uncharacterized protein GSPATT00011755001 [Paramecium tetraurelia]CAK76182.1 unnamed protein product [Paramecium tetraurelia]|eukprot:XP_001443579.1 hypothetical protein (macronuclear) [Paramecium tetraurelia strain d4-2]
MINLQSYQNQYQYLILITFVQHLKDSKYQNTLTQDLAQLDSDQQIKYMDYLLIRFPQLIFLFWIKGFILMNEKKYDEALLTFSAALSRDPYNFWIASFKAITLSHLKKYQEAIDLLHSVLDISPENIKIQKLIGLILQKFQMKSQSMNKLNQMMKQKFKKISNLIEQ